MKGCSRYDVIHHGHGNVCVVEEERAGCHGDDHGADNKIDLKYSSRARKLR